MMQRPPENCEDGGYYPTLSASGISILSGSSFRDTAYKVQIGKQENIVIGTANRFLALLILSVSILALAGCSQDDDGKTPLNPPGQIEVQWQSVLPNLVYQSTIYYPVQVIVSGVDPETIDSVRAAISDSSGIYVVFFRLYDDAGAFQHDDALNYCSPYSGDLVAKNGVYSRQVNSRFAPQSGFYFLTVAAYSNGKSAFSRPDTVAVFPSLPPQLSNLMLPDSLLSGFASLEILVQAIDPDPLESDSVVSVEMQLYSPAGLPIDAPTALSKVGGGYYGIEIASDFAARKSSGDYIFAFRARDSFDVASDSLGKVVFLQNLPPGLSDSQYPDTLAIPVNPPYTELLITIKSWDEQTAADLKSVYLYSRKPDGSMANNGFPIPMEDNGLPFDPARWNQGYLGDLVAGDSIFSTTAVLYDTSQTGTYTFTFMAEDFAGNSSTPYIDSLIVIP